MTSREHDFDCECDECRRPDDGIKGPFKFAEANSPEDADWRELYAVIEDHLLLYNHDLPGQYELVDAIIAAGWVAPGIYADACRQIARFEELTLALREELAKAQAEAGDPPS